MRKKEKIDKWKKIPEPGQPYKQKNIICGSCGYETKISSGPLLMVFYEDVICPRCGNVIIHSSFTKC